MESDLLERALAYHQAGQLGQAEMLYDTLLRSEPDHPAALHLRGVLAMQNGQIEPAVRWMERAIAIEPNNPHFYNNLGLAFVDGGDLTTAIESYQRGLQCRSDLVELHYNLGIALQMAGQHVAAAQSFRNAFQLDPGCIDSTLALVHEMQHLCDWRDIEQLAQRVIAVVSDTTQELIGTSIAPFSFIALPIPTTPEQQLRCARHWTNGRRPGPAPARAPTTAVRTASRLKIGYISADFRDHPIALLTAELFESHDRQRFEVFGYSIGKHDGSLIGERVIRSFDRFHDLYATSYLQAAQTIRDDKLDILVDLQGHTQNARIEILALRPAPIQVHYLGYPGGMGADFVDYLLVDDYVVPREQQPYYSERLVHLPGCFMVIDRHRAIDSRSPSRQELGLPENGFVFCAFNAFYKMTPALFDVWMRLLKAVPDSILWLRQGDLRAMENLRHEARIRGVHDSRLIFAPSVPMPQHLARQRMANLFLDTFPYNQHSTACDALRVGLPLLTMSGNAFASRVAGSLLHAVDLPEMIATSFAEYEARALQLAHQPECLMKIREKLQLGLQQGRLLDGQAFARTVEQAYHWMWRESQHTEFS